MLYGDSPHKGAAIWNFTDSFVVNIWHEIHLHINGPLCRYSTGQMEFSHKGSVVLSFDDFQTWRWPDSPFRITVYCTANVGFTALDLCLVQMNGLTWCDIICFYPKKGQLLRALLTSFVVSILHESHFHLNGPLCRDSTGQMESSNKG